MTGLAFVRPGAAMTWEAGANSGFGSGELDAMSQSPRIINPTATILSAIRMAYLRTSPCDVKNEVRGEVCIAWEFPLVCRAHIPMHILKQLRLSVFALIALAFAAVAPTLRADGTFPINAVTPEQIAEYKLDAAFFKKATLVQNILIATSDKVSDFTHREAAYQFDMVMKSIAPEVAERIREKKVLCVLIAHNELTSDVPMFASDKTGKDLDFYNWRQRGFLTKRLGRSVVLFAEEDVLEYEGGMQTESILIHEFGHVIQGAGFTPEQNARVKAAFEHAKKTGLYNDGYAALRFRRVKSEKPVSLLDALVKSFPEQKAEFLGKCLDGGDILVNGKASNAKVEVTKNDKVLIVFGGPKETYAAGNPSEYWAEGVQNWYDTNRTMDHDHNHIHTRAEFKKYDPELAAICAEVLSDSEWRFVSPRERAGKDHLVGYDPSTAPKVAKLEHIETAGLDYFDEYWKDFWPRLQEKHAVKAAPKAQE